MEQIFTIAVIGAVSYFVYGKFKKNKLKKRYNKNDNNKHDDIIEFSKDLDGVYKIKDK